MLVKEEGQGRQMRFLDNEQNEEFKHKLHNSLQYKQYLEALQRKGDRLDPSFVAFFRDSDA